MRLHWRFEWDAEKAESNRRKHGVTFDQAAEVLGDPMGDRFHLNEPQEVDDEDRWLTLASEPKNRNLVLAIVWVERIRDGLTYTRVVSARHAERWERKTYEQEIYQG